jgi:hypothetical protein
MFSACTCATVQVRCRKILEVSIAMNSRASMTAHREDLKQHNGAVQHCEVDYKILDTCAPDVVRSRVFKASRLRRTTNQQPSRLLGQRMRQLLDHSAMFTPFETCFRKRLRRIRLSKSSRFTAPTTGVSKESLYLRTTGLNRRNHRRRWHECHLN